MTIEDAYIELLKTNQLRQEAITKLNKEKAKLKEKLEKIKEYITDYPNTCKIKGNCIDDRLCSTCFLGGGLEVCEYIADIIEGAEE